MAATEEGYWWEENAGDNNKSIFDTIRKRHIYETKVPCDEVSLSNLLFRQKFEDLLKDSLHLSLEQTSFEPHRLCSQTSPTI